MPDPNSFEHPVPLSNRINPGALTGNPLVDKAMAAFAGVNPGQLPPPLIPGYTPTDIQRMHYFGTPARTMFDEQFLRSSDPISQGLFNNVQDPGLRDLRRQYEGTALQQQVLSHPSAQFVLGGNPYGGFQNMMNASEYMARGPGAVPLNTQMWAQSRMGAMEQMSDLGNTMMGAMYRGSDGGTSMTPNLAATRGFRTEDPFLVGGHLAARDRFMVSDGRGGQRHAGNTRERAESVGSNLDMLAAGRSVFGDMPAMDMLGNVERMMGTDPTSNPQEFKRRLTKFAALANSVGENAQALAEVQQQMLAGIGGGVGGGGMGMGGRSIGGIMGTLGGTIPMTSRGASVGGWVENVATTATTEYANILAGRRAFGGDLTAGGKQDVMMGVMANQQRREASGVGKAARMIRLLEGNAAISPEMVERYEDAQRSGDRHAIGRVMRDISTDLYQDPTMLGNVMRNEGAYNDFMSTLALSAGPEKAMRAQEMSASDVRSVEKGEMVERATQNRAQRSYRASLRSLRSAGLRPDLEAADRAGYTAMQQALEHGGGTLQGVSAADRGLMAEQLSVWEKSGMSTKQILGAMHKSELFRDIPGGDQLSLVAAEGANINLAGQAIAADKAGDLGIMSSAREVFHSAGKSRLAAASESEVKKLVHAGRFEEAKDKVNRFIDSDESGFSPQMRDHLRKRLNVMETRLTRRTATLEAGGAAGLLQAGEMRGMDPITKRELYGDVNARKGLLESMRVSESGMAEKIAQTTAAPHVGADGQVVVGDAYRETAEAEVRTRQQADVGQLAASAVTKKLQEGVSKSTGGRGGGQGGSDEPVRVIIVNPQDLKTAPPIESGSRKGKQYDFGFGEIGRIFGG